METGFEKYETNVLLALHKNLERGVNNAVDVYANPNHPKRAYAPECYHLSLGLLAAVEDTLFERGVDPHG